MAGYRNQFINRLSSGSTLLPLSMLLKLSGQKLVLPFYHTISNKNLAHIKHLYEVRNEKQFRADLDFLLSQFRPLDLKEFIAIKREGRAIEKPSFLLSFDDGLREFYEVVAPILKEKGIPATCFLNSGFIDNKRLFYRYKASLLIECLEQRPNVIIESEFQFKDWKAEILAVQYDEESKLDLWASAVGLDFDYFLKEKKPYLSSTEIDSLIKQGFTFGAHSIDHPMYSRISEEEQVRQTTESTEFIASRFQLDYRVFSFPFSDFGVKNSYFKRLDSKLDLSFGTAGQKTDSYQKNIQRIPFDMDGLSGEQILKSELVYYLLKSPLAKNKIRRDD